MSGNLREKILLLRSGGKSYKDIRKELGCTLSVISHHCKRAGMDSPNIRFIHPSEVQISEFNRLYLEGYTAKKVGEMTGFSKPCVLKHLSVPKRRRSTGTTKSQSVISWRKRTKGKLVTYLGGKCQLCGYNKCIGALEFHHRNPLEKDFTIGGNSRSFERLKEEADKCLLVCANCHSEIHNCQT